MILGEASVILFIAKQYVESATRGGLFNAIADLYICGGFARLLRRRKVKLAMWLRELLKAIARTSLMRLSHIH